MPLRFRCSHCQHPLAIARRKAGTQITCPMCGRPQQVPASFPGAGPFSYGTPAQRIVALSLAAAILALLAYLVWGWPAAKAPPPEEKAQANTSTAPSQPSPPPSTTDQPVVPAQEVRPQEPVKEEPAPRPEEVSPPLPGPAASKPAPAHQEPPVPEPPAGKPVPEKKSVAMKRLDEKDAEELRKQLLLVPELALDEVPGTGELLVKIAQQMRSKNGVYPGPLLLQRQRPDLASLPLLMGRDCQLGVEPAGDLQGLSVKLRTVLQACIPAGGSDPRPDPDRLRAALLGDDPDHPPEWAQAGAVPALMQLLQAEDRQVRTVLVEVLGRIKDVRATQALAVRAMTDLDAGVRTLAVKELTRRPSKDYRDLLVAGLRYPWLPVMEHAAEALVAVKATDAVPQLVPMLDDPDPRQPATIPLGQARKLLVPEMVRVNHLRNCLLCHAPSFDTGDLVRGAVPTPGKPLPGPATTPAYYTASNSFVRADITYLRQDFSVVQPVADSGVWPSQQRFDYLVRMRTPTAREMQLFRDKKQTSDTGPREVLLFALRELTGKDLGLTSKEWKKAVPEDSLVQAQQARLQGTEAMDQGDWKQLHAVAQTGSAPAVDARVEGLRDELVRAEADKHGAVLSRLRDGKGVVYTTALALAIKDLKGLAQVQARDALAERLTRLKESTLHYKLRDDSAEVRRAAARACGMKKAEAFLPSLIALLYDSDPEVVQAARSSLKTLTDHDEGPEPDATPEQRRAAQEAWRLWWEQHIQPPKKP